MPRGIPNDPAAREAQKAKLAEGRERRRENVQKQREERERAVPPRAPTVRAKGAPPKPRTPSASKAPREHAGAGDDRPRGGFWRGLFDQ